MNSNQRSIKSDLLDLYKMVLQHRDLFDKSIAKRLKYSPNEVEQALEIEQSNERKKNISKPKKETNTSHITDIDQLRSYYNSDLKQLYDHSLDENIKAEILKSHSLDELKRFYAIISSVQLSNNTRKKEIVDMLRYYFNDESRTKSLMKNW